MEYKNNGTIFEKIKFKLFEKLIKFDIQIIFIITETPYYPDIISKINKIEVKKMREILI